MTRDQIIQRAREAWYLNGSQVPTWHELSRFADLVAAHERDRCLAEIEQGIWFDKTSEQILESITKAIRAGCGKNTT